MSEHTRILYILGSFKIGGCQRHIVELLKNLDKNSYDLHVFTMEPGGSFLSEVENLGLKLKCLHISRIRNPSTLLKILKLALYVRRNRIQIIHSYLFEANFVALLAYLFSFKRNLKFVPSRRSIHESRTKKGFWVNRIINSFATRILVVCDAVGQCVTEEGAPKSKIETIYNGIDCRKYSRHMQTDVPGGKTVSRASDGLAVGVVASLNKYKGHKYLIEAIPEVLKKCPDATFHFLGDGPLAGQLKMQAEHLGVSSNIHFEGYQVDINNYLSEFDIFILPSEYEGMSNAILEAMAYELPVVATHVGGNPEMVSDGVTGFLVPPRTPEDLAKKILLLAQDEHLRKRMGKAARALVQERFGLNVMVENYRNFYDRLIERT